MEGREKVSLWAAVDSNHVPPRCLALSCLLLRVGGSTKQPVLSRLVLAACFDDRCPKTKDAGSFQKQP
jgi:hypothetical protein